MFLTVILQPPSPSIAKAFPSIKYGGGRQSLHFRDKFGCGLGSNKHGEGLRYKEDGLDIDAGSELVRRIAKMAPGIGGLVDHLPSFVTENGIMVLVPSTDEGEEMAIISAATRYHSLIIC
ncbi:hypothetical protein M8C21_010348 [Ambrosia artemisiifolia]|uniref:Uncharacterized protein n=1 Tax=Ambrosia artemisiifolia TaxID=4212 RepID=A0AAD5GU58_AMBAR|nr:hypothetical protein M8C21_010348 [Ambrosia artemisiifolia]